ncbi:sex comb on midleg-like protein 4 isoform X1 [Hypomesus transpacificus]|uniref:sex comb on midleg-like protein 4 isoform X1 n=1 Tax=Hypomesus transpacificus TaxID=137520 RepID=UPI001F0716A4|nr:sex comb on midleg-like protein 4 isoform X1 [Hypomesus transpacificus]
MRLRGGRDLEHPPVAWLPTGVLGVRSVRLRLRLDRRDDQGRGCWHLVDLESEAESEPIGRRLRDRAPPTCSNSLMSIQSEASEMQSPLMAPAFVGGPSGKVPGRKRGRPPIRKLEFQSHYPEPLLSPKVPKKRGRKPGFKLKPRMVMTSLANSPTSSTPEPDMSSIPQDAATVPHSATPQVLTGPHRYTPTVPHSASPQVLTGTHLLSPTLPPHKSSQVHTHCPPLCYATGPHRYTPTVPHSASPQVLTGPHRYTPTVPHSATPQVLTGSANLTSAKCALKGCHHPFISPLLTFHLLEALVHTPTEQAETSMPEDFLCDPVDSKRYAVDPSDSAFSVMTTPFPPKHTYGYRGSSGGSAPLGMCRQASSPAYNPSQEAGEGKRPPSKDPSSWGVDQVVWFIKDADPQALGPHAEAFRKHEIDGHALLLLKSDMMMKYLGLKLGPALKLSYHIDRLRQNRF